MSPPVIAARTGAKALFCFEFEAKMEVGEYEYERN
jgi:hypothetical protein